MEAMKAEESQQAEVVAQESAASRKDDELEYEIEDGVGMMDDMPSDQMEESQEMEFNFV